MSRDREMAALVAADRRDFAHQEFEDSIEDPEMPVLVNDAGAQILDHEPFAGDGGDAAFQTDQEHLFALIGETKIHPETGEVMEELDAKTLLAHRQREEANAEASYANPNPPSWDRGNLGLTVTCLPGNPTSDEGITKQAAYWPGDDREARVVAIAAMPQVPLVNPVAATGLVRAFMRLTFATASGQFQRVDVDIGTGVVLCVACSAVSVEVGLDGGSTVSAQITASVSFGVPLKNLPATRTSYQDAQGTGSGSVLTRNRPRFATAIVGFDRQFYSAQYTLTFLDQNANVVGQRIIAANTDLQVPVALGNDVRAVQVQNDGISAGSSRLLWGLSL